MSGLLKADLYRILKSKLTLVAFILVVAFPFLMSLMYYGINAAMFDEELEMGTVFSANTVISSAYSLTNNLGVVLPIFAGLLVVMDFSTGTIRNKVIAGQSRVAIYLSHLISSMIFIVTMITIYAAMTAVFGLIFLKFNKFDDLWKHVIRFVITGTACFMYVATISTFFAMTTRNTALTIIFTLTVTLVLTLAMPVVNFLDYEKYKTLIYLIPTYSNANGGLPGGTIIDILQPVDRSDQVFYEGLASYAVFGVLNTVIGCLIFHKKDLK